MAGGERIGRRNAGERRGVQEEAAQPTLSAPF